VPGLGTLSARERELVTLVARGRTDAQIAEQLYISIRTVRSHLDRIRDKTGCCFAYLSSRVHAAPHLRWITGALAAVVSCLLAWGPHRPGRVRRHHPGSGIPRPRLRPRPRAARPDLPLAAPAGILEAIYSPTRGINSAAGARFLP
jgi:DNA-binding CsgD family transcriptional regulator